MSSLILWRRVAKLEVINNNRGGGGYYERVCWTKISCRDDIGRIYSTFGGEAFVDRSQSYAFFVVLGEEQRLDYL
jgi:hypothetical protein